MLATVTGGCGFIGSHLVRRLLADGSRVVVLDDFSSGQPHHLPAHPRLRIIHGCVTDAVAMRRALAGADRVFHLAAVVGQVNVCRQPAWAVRVSTESVRHLNRFAPEPLLVLFSSSAVYGLSSELPCREDLDASAGAARDYDGTEDGYAVGKWQSERLTDVRAPDTTIAIRPFNVIGPGQVGTYGMVVPRFVRSALRGEPLSIYGTGDQARSFGDVHAFLDHLLGLVDVWLDGNRPASVFNIGNGVETSINRLADSVDRVLGTTTPRRYLRYGAVYPGKRDVLCRRPSLDRVEAMLGPLSWPPLEATIEEVAAAMSSSSRVEAPLPPLQLAH